MADTEPVTLSPTCDGELAFMRPAFTPDALTALKARYAQLNRESAFQGVVLDLREHPGGLFASAKELLDWFLGEVPMGGARGIDGKLELCTGEVAADDINVPLILLVDGETASAGEWIAAVAQKRRRALLVGSKTRGVAAVALPVELPSGRAISIAVAELIAGAEEAPIHGAGVAPDVDVDGPEFAACLGGFPTASDPQRAVSLAILREQLQPCAHDTCQMCL